MIKERDKKNEKNSEKKRDKTMERKEAKKVKRKSKLYKRWWLQKIQMVLQWIKSACEHFV